MIAASGFASRRRAELLISQGRVTVDGAVATIGLKIDPESAIVAVDGLPLPVNPTTVHYLVYKPAGVVSTASDPHGRKTVVDLVPTDPPVYPAGRLDAESEGLLVVTNDGALTQLLTHPRHGVTKTYLAAVQGVPSSRSVRRLTAGVDLDDGPARAVSATLVDRRRDEALVEVVMAEGRKREVRRMLEAVGHPVTRLVRTAIGPIRDRSLAPGSWRRLEVSELRALYEAAGTTWQDAVDDDP
ncbi:MAG TPA: pseudouridine synthase [Acidimicrobiia bacterium]